MSPGPLYYEQPRPEVLELVPAEARRVLDVGCGAGALGASIIRRQGAEVWGVEPQAEAAAHAKRRLHRVIEGPVEREMASLPEEHFDCIVAADVLEHLVEPWGVLRELRRRLHPEGALVASLPHVGHWSVIRDLVEGRFRYTAEGLLDRTHLRFFTRQGVEELLWNAGFRIERWRATRVGPAAPAAVLDALDRAGVDAAPLRADGDVLQVRLRARRALPLRRRPRVAVVVLNWVGGERVLACLRSLDRVEYPDLQVVVVDNGSTDGSVERIRKRHPHVELLRNGANLGYAGGNNAGIRRALDCGAEWILLLNDDAEAEPGLVEALVASAACIPDAGMLSALVLHGDGSERIWHAGARWDPARQRLELPAAGQPFDADLHGDTRETFCASGCALFVRAELCHRVGLLDEGYFLTWEEVDWCVRARAAGWRSVVVGSARVRHHPSSSFGGDGSPMHRYFMERNRIHFLRAHGGRRAAARALLGALAELLAELPPRPARRPIEGWRTALRRVLRWVRTVRARAGRAPWRARLRALLDAAGGRRGDCPASVRRANAAWVEGRRGAGA